jgi:phosphatidylglycerol---prolipoprotein diacylglyceryl transferase
LWRGAFARQAGNHHPTRYNAPIPLSPHLATQFPVYIPVGHYQIHPHLFFETLTYFIAFRVYLSLRHRFGDPLSTPIRWTVIAAAVAGATAGSKLLFWLEDPQSTWHNIHNPAYLIGGKTIVGALVFGLISVELMKRYIGLHQSTGDLYAVPLALGIAIGRVGCFLTGLSDNTYGIATRLPWAVNFGDGIPRHPTQLYEVAFLLALIPILYRIVGLTTARVVAGDLPAKLRNPTRLMWEQPPSAVHSSEARSLSFPDAPSRIPAGQPPPALFLPGDAFKFFMIAYLSFRLLCDCIKPYPRIFLGLGGIQWACLLVLLYYFRDIGRWLRRHLSVALPQA